MKSVLSTVTISYLSGIKINLFSDGTGTDRAEVVAGERVHQAIVTRTVNTLGYIAASLVDPEFIRVLRIVGSGDWGIFIKHIFPFFVEVDQRR